MSEDKATPRPWNVGTSTLSRIYSDPDCTTRIADCWTPWVDIDTAEANAALIVRAVNRDDLFDELVKVLEELVACKELKHKIEAPLPLVVASDDTAFRQEYAKRKAMNAEYNRRKPIAWEAARALLARIAERKEP